MRLPIVVALVLSAGCAAAPASPPPAPPSDHRAELSDAFSAWRPLLGEWEAVGSGKPGEGTGRFSFAAELQGQVLVRRSHAEYARAGAPKTVHDDLMVVSRDGDRTRAHYVDNEGHAIDYSAAVLDGGTKIVLTSDEHAGQPRFRLTYDLTAPDRPMTSFEIAPPNAPESFHVYVSGPAHRPR